MKYISLKESKYKIKTKLNNIKYINKELKSSKKLLDNINGYSLDINQRKAILTDEDSILLIAGAGSGKTLTIVGKVRYLIERKNIKESEILCISFTNDSVNSLKNALKKNYNYVIDVYTFHKLSLNLLKENNNNVTISQYDLLEYITDEFFYKNLKHKNLLKTDNYIQLKMLIITFINLFKSNNYNVDKFNDIFSKLKYSKEYILLKIIKEIYLEYEEELKSTLSVDFNDMINSAINIINSNYISKKYKYIIIDEYQDTSHVRYKLIKSLKDNLNAKLFVVGDDFQSIYRFTGCNLDIFLNFKKYFKYGKILKIENTYRNSNELIQISSNFIIKNKNQMKKKLKSNKKLDKPIEIIYCNNYKKAMFSIIDNIDTNILILGRNNKDIYKYFNKVESDGKINYKNKNIRYLTVHKSKGLEAENVIIINLEDNVLGFPSKIENNSILKYVLNEKDYYPYEEERRLFYVALTRTKNKVFLLVKKGKESIFVKEIIKDNKKNIKIINF